SLPSASVLAALRRETEGHKAAPDAIAVFADPVFAEDDTRVKHNGSKLPHTPTAQQNGPANDVERSAFEVGAVGGDGHLPRLLSSRTEALSILALVPAAERKQALDFDASMATATSPELARYRIVHFATHALLNSKHPELSGIVLSLVDEQGRPQ